MALIEYDGLAIDVAEDGAGPPLVLVHSPVSGNRQCIDHGVSGCRVISPADAIR